MKKKTLLTELISPKGDLHAPVRNDLPPPDSRVERVPESRVKFKCGHWGRTFSAVRIFGDVIYLMTEQIWAQEECADCVLNQILKGSIRCALCGRLIRDDSLVALYQDCSGFRDDATHTMTEDKSCVIGCAKCIPNRAFLSGVWQNNRYNPARILLDPLSDGAIAIPEELAERMEGLESGEPDNTGGLKN